MFLPRALSTLTDAQTAVQRLTELFEADTVEAKDLINPSLDVAVRAKNATFQWATAQEQDDIDGKSGKGGKKGRKAAPENKEPTKEDVEPFKIENLSLEIPRGRLIGIVGPVGSGKSSILQGVSRGVAKVAHPPVARGDAFDQWHSGVWWHFGILPAVGLDPELDTAG